MYGIEKEKDMKLNPKYFITKDSILNANRRRGFRSESSSSVGSLEAPEEQKQKRYGVNVPIKGIVKNKVREFSSNQSLY